MDFSSQTGIFSPDGRLYQVEYAQHASNQGSTVCVNTYKGKIYVFYEYKQMTNLQIEEEKIVDIGKGIHLIFSGIKPDSYGIIRKCAHDIFNQKLQTASDIKIKSLAGKIAKYKQGFTVKQEYRPVGLKTMLLGFDKTHPKIFVVEADGNFAEYERCAVGYKADKISENFENDGEFAALKALTSVAQKDPKNIRGYVLDNSGALTKLTEEELSTAMNNL